MKLSIIVPTYNIENYIANCLASILPQMTEEVELIIVDDGSIDNTPNIIEKFAEEHRIVFLPQAQNKGVSAARNVGLKAATGEYVSFIDGDDTVEPNYVFILLSAFKSNSKYYAIGWRECGVKGDIIHKPNRMCQGVAMTIIRKDRIFYRFCNRIKMGEDTKFWSDNIPKRERPSIELIDECLYVYFRGREGSASTEWRKKRGK